MYSLIEFNLLYRLEFKLNSVKFMFNWYNGSTSLLNNNIIPNNLNLLEIVLNHIFLYNYPTIDEIVLANITINLITLYYTEWIILSSKFGKDYAGRVIIKHYI